MNTKSFAIGFTAMDSVIAGVSATKRGIVHAAKSTAHGGGSRRKPPRPERSTLPRQSPRSSPARSRQSGAALANYRRMLTHKVRSDEE